ncbi:MAG: outer membrane lipoprotein chaperone LolA [Deltaproteobacteria bacterium]|nr:outer membrane lipoprotein chaperone LolA [Deltaproteobacteria bacterium]
MRVPSFRFIIALLVLYSSFIIHHSSFSAQAASIADLVKRLQARYDSTAGFRADFTQEVESATLGQKVESRGTVAFKKPGRMRWEFSEPQQTLVSDGECFWFYQPADKQVLKTPFQQAFSSSTPASFLTGVGRLDQDFTVSLTGETTDVYQLRLTPKKDAEAIGLLDLAVSAKTFDILQATITDPLGNVTRLRFSNIDRTAPLDDALFHFTAPPGVDVIEALPAS